MLAPSQIQEIQGIKNIKTGISLGNKGEIQIHVRQRPGFKPASAIKTSWPALQPDSAACPRAGISYIPWIYLVYSWYDTLFLAPTATPSSICFGCPCHWDPFGDGNDGDWGRSVCMSCLSGTAFSGGFQFQTRSARAHAQVQESQVCEGVEQNKSYDSSRRCHSWWSWWNGTLASFSTSATWCRTYV